MNDYERLGFQNRAQWEFPTIVNLNVLRGVCPCRCIHCPVGLIDPSERKMHFQETVISMDLYRKVTDEIADTHSGSLLRIHSVGEPLLWSQLGKAVCYSKNRGVKTWIFTSLVTSDRSLLRTVCKNVDIIEVSVNSSSREDYFQTKGIDRWEQVRENILFIRDYIFSHRLCTRLILSRVQSDDPEMDEAFIQYWSQVKGIADVFVRSYHNYNGLLGDKGTEVLIQPCLVHWGRFNIDVNGDAVVCFNELFSETICKDYILGNVLKQSIESIWKSDQLNEIRLFLLQKSRKQVNIPCLTCTTRQLYPPVWETSEKQLAFLEKTKGEEDEDFIDQSAIFRD